MSALTKRTIGIRSWKPLISSQVELRTLQLRYNCNHFRVAELRRIVVIRTEPGIKAGPVSAQFPVIP